MNRSQALAASLASIAGLTSVASAQIPITLFTGVRFDSWNAATAPEGLADWDPESLTQNVSTGLRWDWQANTLPDGTGSVIPPSVVNVADPSVPGISAAYSFPEAAAATIRADGTGARGVNWENIAAAGIGGTFEVWFKPDDLVGTHVIWELGADNKGVAIVQQDDQIVFLTRMTDGTSGTIVEYEYVQSAPLNGTDWHQAVFVISFRSFTCSAYIDGQLVPGSSDMIPLSAGFRWSGANPAGLGTIGDDPAFLGASVATGTIPRTEFTDFNGLIAIHRFYNRDLFAGEVTANYDAVAGAAASLAASDFNEDGVVDNMDQVDLVDFHAGATPDPIGQVLFPFPAEFGGGVQTNDPALDETFAGDSIWQIDFGFNPGGQEHSFRFKDPANNDLIPVAVNDPAAPSVRKAFLMDGVDAFRGPKFEQAEDSSGARMQLWVNFDDTAGNHCLFEAGGTGVGFSVVSLGDRLAAAIATNGGAPNQVELLSDPGVITPGQWHLVELVVRRFVNVEAGIGEGFELYLDGVLLDSINDEIDIDGNVLTDNFNSAGAGNTNFIGGNQAGIGAVQGSARLPSGAETLVNFNGLVGPFRLSQGQAAPAEVAAQYAAETGQEVLNERINLNGDNGANFLDTITGLRVIDAGL